MTSVYENKFDVIFRKLQDEKAQLKKDFDSAYSKDDFRTSMGIMEEIQEVMNKLSALESVEKPFKEIAQISSRVEDLKLEIEIHLEELGKQIKSMDELQCLIDGELETPMKTLRELFSREAERSFTFDFNKFSDDELMTLIHYRKSNFPSRLSAYEDYWTQTVNSEVAKHLGNSQGSTNSREDNNLDLDAPLNVETGDSLNSNCYLDNDEDLSSNTIQISKSAEESPTFDHGVQNLSDFERRNHIPVLTDEETSRILADSEVESVGVEFATPVNSEPSDGSNQISGEQAEIAITAEEIESYESEVTELFDVDEKLRENGFDSIETNEEELTISVEDIEQDLISESMEKVEKVSQVSSDDDFSVSVEELENEFVANSVDSENTEDQYTEVEHTEDHYAEDEYTQDEYAEEGYAEGEYSQDEYSEEDYAEGEYTQDEYAEEGYAEGEYAEAEYAEGDYAESGYSESEYSQEDYSQDEYSDAEYGEVGHTEGEYSEENFAEGDYAEESYAEEEYSEENLDHNESLETAYVEEDELPLEELSIDLDDEVDADIPEMSSDIDQVELEEPQDMNVDSAATVEDNVLDIDDIEIDLEENQDIVIDVDDTVLDLDESDSTDDLGEELNLDDIQIDLDEE